MDLERRVSTISAARMKAGARAPAYRLGGIGALGSSGERARLGGSSRCSRPTTSARPLSSMAMAECLKGLRAGVTVHGFRSSFRDWVGEATELREHLAEAALAPRGRRPKAERAYRRGDALERGREHMAAWEQFCSATDEAGTVVPFRRVGQSAGTATREDC